LKDETLGHQPLTSTGQRLRRGNCNHIRENTDETAGEVTERDGARQGMRRGRVRQPAMTAALLIPTIAVAAITHGEVRARKEAEDQRQRAEQALTTATVASNNLISDLARRLRAITGVPPEMSKELLDRARSLDDQLLVAGHPAPEVLHNKLLHRDLAALHDRIGDAQKALGDLAEAMKSFQASFAIRDRISKFEPGDLGWQRDLAVSYGKIAEVYRQAERIPEAVDALKRGREIVTRLTRLPPDDARLKRHLAQLASQLAEFTRGASARP
jgi:tetratricopeptide (TPR) repeat protein